MVQMIQACDSVPQDLAKILHKCGTLSEVEPSVRAFVSSRSSVEVDATFMSKFRPMLENTSDAFKAAYADIHAYSKTIARANKEYKA